MPGKPDSRMISGPPSRWWLFGAGGIAVTLVLCLLCPQRWVERLVAVGTLGLATVTVGLIWDSREGRREQERNREANAFRAALVEQVENCRQWYTCSPLRGSTAVRPLIDWMPRFEQLTSLLGDVSLPGEVTAYLTWLMARWRLYYEATMRPEFDRVKSLGVPELERRSPNATFTENWGVELDYLQDIVCLVVAEAARRGLDDIAEAFCPDADWLPWLTPRQGPPRGNDTVDAERRAYQSAPPLLRDPAYQSCLPHERNLASRQMAREKRVQTASTTQR